MALFGSKKKETTVAKKTARPTKTLKKSVAVAIPGASSTVSAAAGYILRPRITEKSGLLSQVGVYTFEISRGANKHSVAAAITSLYKVVPVKIAILNNPAKNVFVRGRKGVVSGVRKALVTLKKGDKIDFV